jgi:hypothetical protein
MDWGHNVLIPAMVKADKSDELNPGAHCQFCPAKLSCKAALAWFDEASEDVPTLSLSDEMLSERFDRLQVVAFVRKAIEQEVLKRQLAGHKITSAKLVQQKANRVWRRGAEIVFKNHPAAWSDPELKSPAQMEKITSLAYLVSHWTYTPATGFTSARLDDRRRAVTPPSLADAFQAYTVGADDA